MNTDVSGELLDVVDIDDRVIDVQTRGEIHRLGLMHRAVHILVFNDADELFLQKRSMNKDNDPGLWDSSAAGHVDSGEEYLACAMREIEEELGVAPDTPLEALFRLPPTAETGMEHCLVYKCAHNGPFTLHPDEIDEGRWVSQSEMDALTASADSELTEAVRLIWRRFGGDQAR